MVDVRIVDFLLLYDDGRKSHDDTAMRGTRGKLLFAKNAITSRLQYRIVAVVYYECCTLPAENDTGFLAPAKFRTEKKKKNKGERTNISVLGHPSSSILHHSSFLIQPRIVCVALSE